LYQDAYEETYDDHYYEGSWTYDLNLDVDYFGADIFEITSSKVLVYENERGTLYDTYDVGEYVTQNGMMIVTSIDDGEEYTDTLNYAFENGMLVLSNSYEDEYGQEEYKSHLKKYTGSIPPDSWTKELADDEFEPDNNMESASDIAVGETTEMHTTTDGDVDRYQFTAQAGETYLIQVSGYVDGFCKLYDVDGTTLAFDYYNDYDVDVDVSYWGNPVILWQCPADGTYYFDITGLGGDEEGYYNVSLSESNLQKSSLKTERKVKRNSNTLFK
jgi:hypothetical protein